MKPVTLYKKTNGAAPQPHKLSYTEIILSLEEVVHKDKPISSDAMSEVHSALRQIAMTLHNERVIQL
jgi:hypothetical protein